jgi:protein-disulfide isomerase
MSETPHLPQESTPVTTPAAAPAVAVKDLLIPGAIVVAGLMIGLGLFFGGAVSKGTEAAKAPTAPGATPEAPVDTSDKIDPVTEADHIKGNINAPVKIVEYSDFECPFCKRQHETLKVVTEKYGDNVAWVFRQFPLEQLHQKAMPVALASECVAELGGDAAFWIFTDRYFEETLTNDRTDIETVIPALANEAGVNRAAFTECFESERLKSAVEADVADAIETGGRGTPWSIVIGPDGKTYPINGAQPLAAIEQVIETALNSQE